MPVLEEFGAHAERDDELAEALMLRNGIPRDVVTALRSAGWQVRPSAVFTAPTPERLAALAEPLAAEPAGPATTALIDLDARGTAALDALLKNL